jgi:hypothetical protein
MQRRQLPLQTSFQNWSWQMKRLLATQLRWSATKALQKRSWKMALTIEQVDHSGHLTADYICISYRTKYHVFLKNLLFGFRVWIQHDSISLGWQVAELLNRYNKKLLDGSRRFDSLATHYDRFMAPWFPRVGVCEELVYKKFADTRWTPTAYHALCWSFGMEKTCTVLKIAGLYIGRV